MVSFIQMFIAAAAAVTIFAQKDFQVTNGTQDYLRLSQREFLHQIEIAELQIATVDTRYADRLDVISYEQQQVLSEIQQVNQTLVPMQALSVIWKYCIQKYDSQLVTYNKAQEQLNTCYNDAAVIGESLTKTAKSTISFTKSYVLVQLLNNAANCRSYSQNQTKFEQCYVEQVELAATRVDDDLKSVQDQLDLSLYNANLSIRNGVDCSFKVEKNVLETIAITCKQIEDCERSNRTRSNAIQDSAQVNSVQNLIMGKVNSPNKDPM